MLNILSKIYCSSFNDNHFNDSNMLKEIHEQVDVINNLINKYILYDNKVAIDIPNNIYKFVFIASGSSYHAASIAASYFMNYLRCDAKAYYSSEFSFNPDFQVDNQTLYVFISQSGETSDTNKALNIVSSQTNNTLSITNVENSSLFKKSKYNILVHAGEEKSIASTKALIGQIFCLFLIALKLLENEQIPALSIKDELLAIPNIIEKVFSSENKIIHFAKRISKFDNISVLASDIFFPLAQEGALKIKETSYINANAYPIGEFLHGHIAVLNKKTPVISILNNKNVDFIVNVLKKIKTDYTVDSMIISAIPYNDKGNKNLIEIFTKNEIEFLFGALVTFQLIAFHCAKILGRNIDSPSGLTKVVK